MTDFWKKPPMKGKNKAGDDGDLPCFRTNYRPAGSRETPNSVTGADTGGRLRNDYSGQDKDVLAGGTLYAAFLGPFRP